MKTPKNGDKKTIRIELKTIQAKMHNRAQSEHHMDLGAIPEIYMDVVFLDITLGFSKSQNGIRSIS